MLCIFYNMYGKIAETPGGSDITRDSTENDPARQDGAFVNEERTKIAG
jgi:hypothetical protein